MRFLSNLSECKVFQGSRAIIFYCFTLHKDQMANSSDYYCHLITVCCFSGSNKIKLTWPSNTV